MNWIVNMIGTVMDTIVAGLLYCVWGILRGLELGIEHFGDDVGLAFEWLAYAVTPELLWPVYVGCLLFLATYFALTVVSAVCLTVARKMK